MWNLSVGQSVFSPKSPKLKSETDHSTPVPSRRPVPAHCWDAVREAGARSSKSVLGSFRDPNLFKASLAITPQGFCAFLKNFLSQWHELYTQPPPSRPKDVRGDGSEAHVRRKGCYQQRRMSPRGLEENPGIHATPTFPGGMGGKHCGSGDARAAPLSSGPRESPGPTMTPGGGELAVYLGRSSGRW